MAKILSVILVLSLSGCALFSNMQPNQKELAVKYATFKIIGGKAERALKIVKWVNDAKGYINSDEEVKISYLDTALRKRIPWDKFDPEEALMIDAIIMEVKQKLLADLGGGVLTVEQEIKLFKVLDWVEATASELSKE